MDLFGLAGGVTSVKAVRPSRLLALPSWPGLSGPPNAAPAAKGGPDRPGHDEGWRITTKRRRAVSALPALAICVPLLAGCMVGPDYKRPDAPTPVAFKELQGWKISQPADAVDKGDWWSVYHDPELDRLERMVEVTNQTVKVSEADYRNAVALVAEARASLFPTIGVSPGVSRFGGGGGSGSSVRSSINSGNSSFSSGGRSGTTYSISGTVSWVPDVWGSVRRQIESSVSSAQVSAADLANAKLSAQATLAADYFDLRAEDSLAQLLTETVAAYRRALQITENQYRAGTTASTDYVTALALLQSTQAQLIAVGVQRAQFEHAIAVLTGHPPSDVTIAPAPLAADVPVLPPGLPSELLERRPDIAAAERAMQQENALIGVAVAAYYPTISLSALGEYAGNPIGQLFNVGNQIWSLGASASETVFNGGERRAAVLAARATYDASVATYRQTVLTAFQGVEDALSDLRILELQAQAEALAVASTRRAVEATLNAYKAGTVPYTSVITEQTSLLSNQQSALAVQQSRLVASVALIEALGGGWSSADLPKKIEWANPLPP
jgi:NodT family efflux transporter outer membrane factor (OMF) lipoprotein